MTPEQVALRDAWLAEMWKPVREWHQTFEEKAMSRARDELLNTSTACAESGGKDAA